VPSPAELKMLKSPMPPHPQGEPADVRWTCIAPHCPAYDGRHMVAPREAPLGRRQSRERHAGIHTQCVFAGMGHAV
jgi:hypothetical protein